MAEPAYAFGYHANASIGDGNDEQGGGRYTIGDDEDEDVGVSMAGRGAFGGMR